MPRMVSYLRTIRPASLRSMGERVRTWWHDFDSQSQVAEDLYQHPWSRLNIY